MSVQKENLQAACAKFLDQLTASIPDVMEAFKSRRAGLCTECAAKAEADGSKELEKATLKAGIDALDLVAAIFKIDTSTTAAMVKVDVEKFTALKDHIGAAKEKLAKMG